MNDFVLSTLINDNPIFKYSYSEHLEKPYTIYLTNKIVMHCDENTFDEFVAIIFDNMEEN